MSISIRQLHENDWRLLSEVRLKALQTDPQVFGSNFEYESKFTIDDWKSRLKAKDSAVFMLFDGDAPIGMTGVAIDREDVTRRTALLWGSWLETAYRGRGVSKLIYRTRIDWAKAQRSVERIVVSHRASNHASKYANQKHGFVLTRTLEKLWHDGLTEDEVFYELKLTETES